MRSMISRLERYLYRTKRFDIERRKIKSNEIQKRGWKNEKSGVEIKGW